MQRTKPKRATLSEKQRAVLAYIRWHQDHHGMPPTTKETSQHFGIGFSPAYRLIEQLIRKGYLRRRFGIARGLKVLRNPDGTAVRS